jgi:hypothetical protein
MNSPGQVGLSRLLLPHDCAPLVPPFLTLTIQPLPPNLLQWLKNVETGLQRCPGISEKVARGLTCACAKLIFVFLNLRVQVALLQSIARELLTALAHLKVSARVASRLR